MASMVAKACSSSSSEVATMMVYEKVSRNKRKFRADPPLSDTSKITPNEFTNFEFSAEKFEIIPSHNHTIGCDMCCVNQDSSSDSLKLGLGLSFGTSEVGSFRRREEVESCPDESHDANWSDLTESQLEELVLSNLDAIFKSAIKNIIASGYCEEVATKAILRSGLLYGCKDTLSNIVENTLAFLRSGQNIDPSRENYFENLQQMERYILAELVCLLRAVRPFFSTGDAMWCLLICDMNVSQACAMDSEPLGGLLGDVSSNDNSSISALPHTKNELKSSEPNLSVPCKSNKSAGSTSQSESPSLNSDPNINQKGSVCLEQVPDKKCQISMSNYYERPFNAVTSDKYIGSRKLSGIAKREYILRQKSIHFDKHYRTYGSKSTSRSGKLSTFGGLVLDKKLKAVAESTGVTSKNALFKFSKAVGSDESQDKTSPDLSARTGFSSEPTFGFEAISGNSSLPQPSVPHSLPIADTELSLSFPAKTVANPMPISYKVEPANRKPHGHWGPHDRKDEMIMKLVPKVKELQNNLQEWTEWANQKVMQAARRLSKDKAELKTLKQEREEVERLKKEKQTLEENTMKKLSEMENALCKASGQVQRANTAVRRLEVENVGLRRDMEAAKLRAAESAASCEEVSKREKKSLMKFQSWEKQKTIFQEELTVEKHNLMQLQQRLQQVKDVYSQAETRLNQEMKSKDDLNTQASSYRKEREKIEVSAKSKEDTIKSKAENNLEKYKDDIKNLEKEISQLRLKKDSSKIAALRRGIDGSYASKTTDIRNTQATKNLAVSYIFSGNGGVKRERECVMCLSEEMSVVFLPCAHQVVCTMCNELHEKQGMKDCPSCRSPIQRRVSVRYARS